MKFFERFKKNKTPPAEEEKKSELAERLKIRISKPYGYYPEDVDKIILSLEERNKYLEGSALNLTRENNDLTDKNIKLKNEITKLKVQMSMIDIPNTTTEQDIAMLGRINEITGEANKKLKL